MDTARTPFKPVPEHPSFPEEEEKVLKYWNEIDAFHTQNEKTKDFPPYTFYDGPPFATGLPHYGHICAGTIKDVVTRYAVQTGHSVERRFGWDCHGLPIEYEIDKLHDIKTRDQVLEVGIKQYNDWCRSIVMKYSGEWEQVVTRLGRWIDFKNDYKTMDLKFMESVWAVFKKIFDQKLVYRGAKIMPYSIGCSTVLSNFEAGQNYQEVFDPSVYAAFPLVNEPETSLVAWTTTPWTLPSNLILCVNKDFDYVKVQDIKREKVLILAQCRLGDLYKKKDEYKILDTFKGSVLEGKEYVPLFDYYVEKFHKRGAFRVLCAPHVTSDTGTGIVHTAPGFGADDYKICKQREIIEPHDPPAPVDPSGFFMDPISDYKGRYIKDKQTEKDIMKAIKEKGRLIADGQYKHSYPFCWRSEKPLIYKAVNTWFIKVTDVKD
jgi:isoleucyl-tRNA synthetase